MQKSIVIRQKSESENGGNKKSKAAKFSENGHFLPPDKKCSLFLKFGGRGFLVTTILLFALLSYYRRL